MASGDIKGADLVIRDFEKLRKAIPDATRSGLKECALLGMREAKANAPRSPTMKILSRTLKRKKRTAQRTMPGGLERSIFCESDDKRASVFVPLNSEAAKYARYIHDEKGKRWFNRGAGTIAKGQRADDKFIARAIHDNKSKFLAILKHYLERAVK